MKEVTKITLSEIDIQANTIQKWQNIVNILVKLLNVPVALIMKVDPPFIEVFRSSHSDTNPYKVGDREHLAGLYCERVIKTQQELLIPNAKKDAEWDKNPDIKLGMISYLGLPLNWPNGDIFGTICVLDSKENRYNDESKKILTQFKETVEAHLELLYDKSRLEEAYNQTKFYKDLLSHDINNILQNISFLTGIISSSTSLPLDLKENLEHVENQIKHAAKLITNVQKFSDIQSKDSPLSSIEDLRSPQTGNF